LREVFINRTIGKGVIVGEELLITGDEYLYGIRVRSERRVYILTRY